MYIRIGAHAMPVLHAAGLKFQLGKGIVMSEGGDVTIIATRTASAVKAMAEAGKIDASEFPLLLHVDKLLNEGEKVNIPWSDFQTTTRDKK